MKPPDTEVFFGQGDIMGKEGNEGKDRPVGPSFTGVVKGVFDPAELQGLTGELIGFKGDLATKIAEWQEKGFGRIIGIPLASGSRGSLNLDPSQQYRGVAYVLPYRVDAEKPDQNSYLVLMQEGEQTQGCVVVSRTSNAIDDRDLESEQETFLSEFNSTFTPSKTACTNHFWRPDLEEGTILESFIRNAPEMFSAVVLFASFSEEGLEAAVTATVARAEALQEAQRARSVSGFSASDEAWLDGLDSSLAKELGREEGRRTIAAAPVDLSTLLDPDDVIDLADASRRISREEGEGN